MKQSARLLRVIQYALLGSVLLYVFVGEEVTRAAIANPMLFYALSFASVTTVGVMLVMRRTLVLPSESALRSRPDDTASLNRWRTGYIITYALSEALALFGLVLRLTGFTLSQVAPFYIAGFVLLLFFSPRPRLAEAR
jgi:FtsH-binding integral membrane protein